MFENIRSIRSEIRGPQLALRILELSSDWQHAYSRTCLGWFLDEQYIVKGVYKPPELDDAGRFTISANLDK